MQQQLTADGKANRPIATQTTWGLRDKLFLLLIVSALAVFVGQSFEDTVRQVVPEQRVFRSVVNKKESGLSALLSIASGSGLRCQMWLLPYRRLSDVKGLLYVVQPTMPWTDNEVKDILAWVRQGNQLVYFDSFCRGGDSYPPAVPFASHRSLRDGRQTVKKIGKSALLHKLGLSVEWRDNKKIIYNYRLPEMAHVNKLLLKPEVKIIGGRPLVACNEGAYITAVKCGSGRILLGTVPELCANVKLGKENNYDNFQFMINCLRPTNGIILFDEYCHGIQGEGNVFVYFSRRLPGLICLQLLLMFIPAELSTRQRFGSLKTLKTSRHISDLAYVSGLANVYKRAQANLVALEIIVGFWKTKLCRQLGLSARVSTDEILQRAKDSNIEAFLSDYEQTLSEGEIGKARLTQLISRCDALNIQKR